MLNRKAMQSQNETDIGEACSFTTPHFRAGVHHRERDVVKNLDRRVMMSNLLIGGFLSPTRSAS
jgi:hypothetical protein